MSSITWAQAREIAREHAVRTWQPSMGTLWVAPDGLEDADGYLVQVEAEEAQADTVEALEFVFMDPPMTFVRKADGVVEQPGPYLSVADRVDRMTPVRL